MQNIEITPKQFYAMRKHAGVCVFCGRVDALTMNGHPKCSRCRDTSRDAERKYCERHREELRERQKKIRQDRIEHGLCTRCGRPAPKGRHVCQKCVDETCNNAREKRIASGTNYPRGDNGFCFTCNKNLAMPGKKLCKQCYDNTISAQKQATKWHKENGNCQSVQENIEALWKLKHAKRTSTKNTTRTVE